MNKYDLKFSKVFDEHFKKIAKSSDDWVISEITLALQELAETGGLPEGYSDHQLKEQLVNEREFHVLDDLLIKYRINENQLLITAIDIGTHNNLF
jgi:mRNA interferase YafQ